MQAAAPIMSSLVIYLLAISASMFSFKKFKESFVTSRYFIGLAFLFLGILSFSFLLLNNSKETIAKAFNPTDNTFPIASNTPIGEAKGLFPGRVVWMHDDGATNENYVPLKNSTNYWYSNTNANEAVIKEMLSAALVKYSGTTNIADAWDAIFKSYNNSHGHGNIGYTSGEKIAFKINLTNQSCSSAERPQRMDVAPQLLNAILDELVNVVGVAQTDITMGDPYREFRKEYRDLVKSKFPNVYYVDGAGSTTYGIHQTKPSADAVLKFSNKVIESTLPQQYLDATYVINIPCLKTHNDGGITLIAKNHQGSFLESGDDPKGQYAIKMHAYLPTQSSGEGNYRHTVDYMGHEQTGGKALIYIIDGIWGGESWEGWITKFQSEPFNNDYPNSIFVGQDPVALESVGFDILFEENIQDNAKQDYPINLKVEIADYLKQCASSDYWPVGIQYDPEGDGTPIGSLGVFEHWNNATDRKYSRNMGTGQGIELNYYKAPFTSISTYPQNEISLASPNPFSEFVEIKRPAEASVNSECSIYNTEGRLIKTMSFSGTNAIVWNGCNSENTAVAEGVYIYKIHDKTTNALFTGKIMLKR